MTTLVLIARPAESLSWVEREPQGAPRSLGSRSVRERPADHARVPSFLHYSSEWGNLPQCLRRFSQENTGPCCSRHVHPRSGEVSFRWSGLSPPDRVRNGAPMDTCPRPTRPTNAGPDGPFLPRRILCASSNLEGESSSFLFPSLARVGRAPHLPEPFILGGSSRGLPAGTRANAAGSRWLGRSARGNFELCPG